MKVAAILFGAVVFAGLGSPPLHAATPAPTPTLLLIDGAGTIVGPVQQDASGSIWVEHEVEGVSTRLLFGDKGPEDTKTHEPLLYESPDCSGTATINVPDRPDAARSAVVFATDVYLPAGTGSNRTIHSVAWLVRNNDDCTAALVGPNLCCAALPAAQVVRSAPVTGIALTKLQLHSPFHVEPAH